MASPQLHESLPLWQTVHELQEPSLRIGASRLAWGPCWNIRMLSAGSVGARKAIEKVRELYYEACARRKPNLRRQ